MPSKSDRLSIFMMIATLSLVMAIPALSQETGTSTSAIANAALVRMTAGQSAVFQGAIVKRGPDGFTLRDFNGSLVQVALTDSTIIKERKSNPFRGARNYGVTELIPGLKVEVKGNGASSGELEAKEIRFTQDELRLANIMEARVIPVEERLTSGETRLTRTEENAQHISGQVSEVSTVANAARSSAKTAQETADTALESARQANEAASNAKAGVLAANDRIAALDDFEAKTSLIVNFQVGASAISSEAQAQLDKFAEEAKNEKGFVIEVAGFASADGDEASNRVLSQKRADAVIRYLAENHSIPLRRFITPFGYGEKMPLGDNQTRDGRIKNRRVEAKILVSKGQTQESASSVATAR